MISDLILFCGGSPIHNHKPKPLALMPNSSTILEVFSTQKFLDQIPQVTLIVEENFLSQYDTLVRRMRTSGLRVQLLETLDGTTTFEKLEMFLSSNTAMGDSFLFTYPDIFFFGNWDELLRKSGETLQIEISGVYLRSRFPTIDYNPYTQQIRSLSLMPSRIPANSTTIYAGHLASKKQLLSRYVREFREHFRKGDKPSLEGDFFKFLVGAGKLNVHILDGAWIKADSTKEMMEILMLLKGT